MERHFDIINLSKIPTRKIKEIKAIALGADCVYIATAALLALGCHLCRSCHSGKCNWGKPHRYQS